MTDKASLLFEFFAGYFHEDWMVDHPNWEGVVDSYVRRNSTGDKVQHLAAAIRQLADEAATDADVQRRLEEFGTSYLFHPTESARAWLYALSERLSRAGGA